MFQKNTVIKYDKCSSCIKYILYHSVMPLKNYVKGLIGVKKFVLYINVMVLKNVKN